MSFNSKKSDTSCRLGPVRFAYTNVFTPRENPSGGDPKYSLCVIIPKTDKETLKFFNDAYEAAKTVGKNSKWGGKIPARVKSPLRDGDIEREGDDAFAGCYFFNCSSKNKPGVGIIENGNLVDALDNTEFYSGCYGAVTINMFPYATSGNIGVGVGLGNVVKTDDGERLSGSGGTVQSDFNDLVF